MVDACRHLRFSEAAFFVCARRLAYLAVSELRTPRSLEVENRRLKQVLADLTLDRLTLSEAIQRNA